MSLKKSVGYQPKNAVSTFDPGYKNIEKLIHMGKEIQGGLLEKGPRGAGGLVDGLG